MAKREDGHLAHLARAESHTLASSVLPRWTHARRAKNFALCRKLDLFQWLRHANKEAAAMTWKSVRTLRFDRLQMRRDRKPSDGSVFCVSCG